MNLQLLADALSGAGLLGDAVVDGDFVHGRAHLPAADADVNLNVDPELEEDPGADVDVELLVGKAARFLAIPTAHWQRIVDQVAGELEDAAGDDLVAERTDLRDDLAIRSVVVLADAVLLSFDAPRQFPGGAVRVQLDDDELLVEDLEVDLPELVLIGDAETRAFDNLDDLVDHLTDET